MLLKQELIHHVNEHGQPVTIPRVWNNVNFFVPLELDAKEEKECAN